MRLAACVVGAGIAVGAWGVGVRAEEARDILFFGNSFTQSAGGVELIVRDVAVAAGHPEPYVRALAVAGQDLAFHVALGTGAIEAWEPADGTWEDVVMQEHSTRPTTHPTEGDVPAFRASATALYGAVLDHSPGARATLFETWARGPRHEFYPDIFASPFAMQRELWESYGLAAGDIDAAYGAGSARVAPVGEAFRFHRWNDLHADDRWHANTRGGLLAGLVLYGTIYGDQTVSDVDLSGVVARLGLTGADGEELAAVADALLIPGPGAGAALGLGLVVVGSRRRRGRGCQIGRGWGGGRRRWRAGRGIGA